MAWVRRTFLNAAVLDTDHLVAAPHWADVYKKPQDTVIGASSLMCRRELDQSAAGSKTEVFELIDFLLVEKTWCFHNWDSAIPRSSHQSLRSEQRIVQ